jgi:DNA-binding NarL/FixJ family response regulator
MFGRGNLIRWEPLLMTQIRILLVDDSPDFLQAAAHFLGSDPCLQIIGRAQAAEDALELLPALEPDLVLMDLALPGMNGLEATRRLKELASPPVVILLTMHNLEEYRLAAPQARADGFVTKSEFGVDLLPLIHRLFNLPDSTEVIENGVPC